MWDGKISQPEPPNNPSRHHNHKILNATSESLSLQHVFGLLNPEPFQAGAGSSVWLLNNLIPANTWGLWLFFPWWTAVSWYSEWILTWSGCEPDKVLVLRYVSGSGPLIDWIVCTSWVCKSWRARVISDRTRPVVYRSSPMYFLKCPPAGAGACSGILQKWCEHVGGRGAGSWQGSKAYYFRFLSDFWSWVWARPNFCFMPVIYEVLVSVWGWRAKDRDERAVCGTIEVAGMWYGFGFLRSVRPYRGNH